MHWIVRQGPVVRIQYRCYLPSRTDSFKLSASHGGSTVEAEGSFDGYADEIVLTNVDTTQQIEVTVTFEKSVSISDDGVLILNVLEFPDTSLDTSVRTLSCSDTAASWPMKYLAPPEVRSKVPPHLRSAFIAHTTAVFRVQCPQSCQWDGAMVMGSVQYVAESSVCLSAQHRGVQGPMSRNHDLFVAMLDEHPFPLSNVYLPVGSFSMMRSLSFWGRRLFDSDFVGYPSIRHLVQAGSKESAMEGVSTSRNVTTYAAPGAFLFLLPGSGFASLAHRFEFYPAPAMGGPVSDSVVNAYGFVAPKERAPAAFGPRAEARRAAHPWFGYGLLSLRNSLPLPTDTSRASVLVLADGKSHSVANKGINRQCFFISALPGARLDHIAVTLVWTDPPAASGAFRQLVNDLDLVLLSYQSDNDTSPGRLPGNGEEDGDRRNNVEKVVVATPKSRIFCANVSGSVAMGASQPYALTVHASCSSNCLCGIVKSTY